MFSRVRNAYLTRNRMFGYHGNKQLEKRLIRAGAHVAFQYVYIPVYIENCCITSFIQRTFKTDFRTVSEVGKRGEGVELVNLVSANDIKNNIISSHLMKRCREII